MSPSSKKTELVEPPRKRQQFGPAEKLRIVREADACQERGEVGALLRREGIYGSHLAAWRKVSTILRHADCELTERRSPTSWRASRAG